MSDHSTTPPEGMTIDELQLLKDEVEHLKAKLGREEARVADFSRGLEQTKESLERIRAFRTRLIKLFHDCATPAEAQAALAMYRDADQIARLEDHNAQLQGWLKTATDRAEKAEVDLEGYRSSPENAEQAAIIANLRDQVKAHHNQVILLTRELNAERTIKAPAQSAAQCETPKPFADGSPEARLLEIGARLRIAANEALNLDEIPGVNLKAMIIGGLLTAIEVACHDSLKVYEQATAKSEE